MNTTVTTPNASVHTLDPVRREDSVTAKAAELIIASTPVWLLRVAEICKYQWTNMELPSLINRRTGGTCNSCKDSG